MKTYVVLGVFALFILIGGQSYAQVLKNDGASQSGSSGRLLTDMIDTATQMGRNMLSMYNKFGQLGFSGYIQSQYQVSEIKGNPNPYQGGEWGPYTSNRFRLRRGRLRADFTHNTSEGKPSVYFLFQFDGTERGVNIRDFWGRYYENKWELFHFSAGMMARPFGFEILYSSTYREAPERGRMSQVLMGTERDLGMMVSMNPRSKKTKLKWLMVDAGIYNGQGLTGTSEYDNLKDVIVRVSTKQRNIGSSNVKIAGGVSALVGGITNLNKQIYTMKEVGGQWNMTAGDVADTNHMGEKAARQYFGADARVVIPNHKGVTEFRGEYITGTQSGTLSTSVTPGTYPVASNGMNQPLAVRRFDGAYFYFLQHLGSWSHQLVGKFDWYDPNKKVKGTDIGADRGLTAADIRYNAWGAGYVYYINPHLKLTFWYEKPTNEKTRLSGFEKDVKDGIFTFRTQFSF
ncbi:porin [Niabella sp. 22666]|uniref:porin n=1 Tax=Niabella sp. 22666 TaxID=3453954 RepID=UPI003F830005